LKNKKSKIMLINYNKI